MIMKKALLVCVAILFLLGSTAFAADLKVGEKAPNFNLKDTNGNNVTLNSPVIAGKVISLFYADPGSKDMNNEAQAALKTAPGIERNVKYKGLGVVNLKASMVPDFILNRMIASKQKESPDAIFLLDPDYILLNAWGLTNKVSNVIVLDKQRICRFIYRGKVPKAEIDKMLNVIREYQNK
jgi:predicted transcriptional regulator